MEPTAFKVIQYSTIVSVKQNYICSWKFTTLLWKTYNPKIINRFLRYVTPGYFNLKQVRIIQATRRLNFAPKNCFKYPVVSFSYLIHHFFS